MPPSSIHIITKRRPEELCPTTIRMPPTSKHYDYPHRMFRLAPLTSSAGAVGAMKAARLMILGRISPPANMSW